MEFEKSNFKFAILDSTVESIQLHKLYLKEPSSIFSTFFSNFWRFCYHKKGHIFFITHGKFYSQKVFHLEDINENVSGYGNYN